MAGLGSALGTVLGVGGIASNILTNQQNADLNERNYRLALRQQEFAENSFNRQMQYNSPVTQAFLNRAAGVNPALGDMSGSVSTAGNGSIPSNLSMNPLDPNALNGLAQNVALLDSQKKNVESSTQKNVSDAEKTVEDTRTVIMKRIAELNEINSRNDLNDSQREVNNQLIQQYKKQIKFMDENLEWQNHNLRMDAQAKAYDNNIRQIQMRYLPMLNDQQIRLLVSQMALNYATANKEKRSADLLSQETASEFLRTGILGNQFNATLPAGIMGKSYADGLKNSPTMRRIQTTLQHVVYPMLQNMPSLFLPIK